MSSQVLNQRGSSICRGCQSTNLIDVLDLGSHPLPAEYGLRPEDELDTFPLQLKLCRDCGLGQIGEYVFPERIFHETYPYLSSASSTWVQHAANYASEMVQKLSLDNDSLVVELASNDGYLLEQFSEKGIPVLGIEPTSNTANIAEAKGIPTIVEFFGTDLAEELIHKYGKPNLIVANNVYAHVPDLDDFTQGLSKLCGENTVITIENPTFLKLLSNNLFDTIYHEHYSYLSAHAVSKLAARHGLNLFHVDTLVTHGGSNRYWLGKSQKINKSVSDKLQEELQLGLFDPDFLQSFASRARQSISEFRAWLEVRKASQDVVVAYGAAHKGNTFLNSVGVASKYIQYVVDASFEKQGKYLPGSQIPVLPPSQLAKSDPTDVVILPWNIADELASNISNLAPKAKIWVAQPKLRQL